MITINPDPDNPNMIYTCRIPENDILWVDITKTELIRRLNEYWNITEEKPKTCVSYPDYHKRYIKEKLNKKYPVTDSQLRKKPYYVYDFKYYMFYNTRKTTWQFVPEEVIQMIEFEKAGYNIKEIYNIMDFIYDRVTLESLYKWFNVYHEGKLDVAICFMIDNYLWSNDDKPLKKDYVMRGI